jgi:hypothetical protein
MGGLQEVTPTRRQCRSTRTALFIRAQLPYEEWRQVGDQLLKVADSSAWWVGDWLLYGQREFADRYERAIAQTGFDYQTLRNYAWVASRFAPSRRRDTLSFSHHAELASLEPDDQDDWLRRAELHSWSRNKLRAALRQSGEGARRFVSEPPIKLDVPRKRRELWQAAAEATGRDLDEWIEASLDEAASIVLGARDSAVAA